MDALVCPLCRIALPTVDEVCPRDGRPGVNAAWLPVPPALGQRFRVLEPFAHGATGSLYLADEPETCRRGLLKILAPVAKEQLPERQRLRRELVKQATLPRGQLIVPLASGESEGSTWIFREWLDGVSLEVRLSRGGALQQTEALAIAAQIATALDELHRGGLLHRDVKPGHVFLQPTAHGIPRALLLDAGVASTLETASGSKLQGTAGYIAPEQLLGGLASFRSDLYSLGCTLYRMLTGRPAFPGETLEEIMVAQRRGDLPPIPASLPNGIGALLLSILAKDPQERPFSAQKLRRTLDPFLPDGALMEKQPTSTFETVPKPRPSAAPQPSGTLRPPAPPSTRPGAPAGTLPPPMPVRAATKAREEGTQLIDIGQIEEVSPVAKRRTTSVPPPTPQKASSSKPPKATSSKPPPLRKPGPAGEQTQPIRLDQILAVNATRHRSEPPTAPEPHAPEAAPVAQPAIGGGEPSLFASATPTGGTDQAVAGVRPRPSDRSEPEEQAREALETQPGRQREGGEPARAKARGIPKATLMGIGLDLDATTPFAPRRDLDATTPFAPRAEVDAITPAASPSDQPSMMVMSEREQPTERFAVTKPATDGDSERPPVGSIPAGTLATLGGARADSRRLLMYASAALVGLGVLGVGASALFSGSETPAAAKPPPALAAAPAAVQPSEPKAAQPSEPKPVPAQALAEAPRPLVEALPPPSKATPVISQPAAAAPATETQATGEPTPARASLAADDAASAKASARARAAKERELAAREREAAKEREQAAKERARATRERERASKTASSAPAADKVTDKSAQIAEAREQARSLYAAKRYKEAAAAFERATRLDASQAGPFAGLGAARLQIGDAKGALAAYQRAVQLSPNTSGFHAALGRAYLASGDKARASASYKRALSLDPNNTAAKTALAELGSK